MRIGLLGAGRIGAFHAGTLAAHPAVGELLIADADLVRAGQVAGQVAAEHGGRAREPTAGSLAADSLTVDLPAVESLTVDAVTVDALFAARPDAVVIAAATSTHAGLIARAARAGLPAFCEKPLSRDLAGTLAALTAVEAAGAVLQVGFQRRFDPGYTAAREAVRAGRMGRLHTVRTVSSDPAPPPAAYIPLSGGLYRDCLIHDFDILRWVTGREVTEVYAAGTDGGADFFRGAGDVDTAAALLTLDGGVLATATATRYHAAGYDVRMELAGTQDQLTVGTGPRAPLTSLEPGAALAAAPAAGGRWPGFLDRFTAAYRAELDVFLRVARGEAANPCEGREALRALLVAEACEVSRRERRPVAMAEVEAAARACGDVKGAVVA
jgi:myo-inositol 2-dehydrogenase / D-chiro-inositol 1-dehydrogenase